MQREANQLTTKGKASSSSDKTQQHFAYSKCVFSGFNFFLSNIRSPYECKREKRKKESKNIKFFTYLSNVYREVNASDLWNAASPYHRNMRILTINFLLFH